VKNHSDYDPTDRIKAMNYIQMHQAKGEVVTGLLYVQTEAGDLYDHLNRSDVSLNQLSEKELSPGSALLEKINSSLR
jgi:2-oxoglutarate ferredoxin oxidoreductase subunit beta